MIKKCERLIFAAEKLHHQIRPAQRNTLGVKDTANRVLVGKEYFNILRGLGATV